jgi:hypothetical protein
LETVGELELKYHLERLSRKDKIEGLKESEW